MPIDRRHDDFNDTFMEQRIQKLNNPEQSGMEVSLPFGTEPLRTTAPVTLPGERVSFTSSDFRVKSPDVQSRARPKTKGVIIFNA